LSMKDVSSERSSILTSVLDISRETIFTSILGSYRYNEEGRMEKQEKNEHFGREKVSRKTRDNVRKEQSHSKLTKAHKAKTTYKMQGKITSMHTSAKFKRI